MTDFETNSVGTKAELDRYRVALVEIQQICSEKFGRGAKSEHAALNDVFRTVNSALMPTKQD